MKWYVFQEWYEGIIGLCKILLHYNYRPIGYRSVEIIHKKYSRYEFKIKSSDLKIFAFMKNLKNTLHPLPYSYRPLTKKQKMNNETISNANDGLSILMNSSAILEMCANSALKLTSLCFTTSFIRTRIYPFYFKGVQFPS